MRTAFEAWAKPRSYNVIRDGDDYLLRETRIAWEVWQGAVAWEREECAKLCDDRKIITPEWQLDKHYNQATKHCADAIRARTK